MNYDAFMEPVTWFLTGMEKHSDEYNEGMYGNSDCFIGAMKYHMASFYAPSLMVSMNELSNHDHSRFLTRTNHKVGRVANLGSHAASEDINKAVLREAVVMQMTWLAHRLFIMETKQGYVDLQTRITEEPIRGEMKIKS